MAAVAGGMILLLAKTAVWFALLAACLFLPAGTIAWPMAWADMAAYAAAAAAAFFVVDHELLRERASPHAGTEPADALIGTISALFLYPGTLVIAGVDHAKSWSGGLHLSGAIIALAFFVAGYALALWAMSANRFFTTFVRVQTDRGHQVINSGPYAWVRHPGYAGTLIAHLALPIALGSWWALLPAAVGGLLLLPRAVMEERTLAAKLDGYAEYLRDVRWRLLPGVW